MSNTAHSYHPTDDSLEAKVMSLRSALMDKQTAQASLEVNDSERLGSKEEIQYALSMSEQTLGLALNDLTANEIKEAQAQGLLSKEELLEAKIAQRSVQMKVKRNQTSAEDSHSHKL